MSSVVLQGDTSGAITLTVPAIAGTNTVSIPAGTGTVAVQGVSTNIVSGTAVASTSGTAIDFTGIPSWVKRITVMFNGVSTSGSSQETIQIGSGSITSSGYTSQVAQTNGVVTTGITNGLRVVYDLSSSHTLTGTAIFTLISGNSWIGAGTMSRSDGYGEIFGTYITLGGTLDRLRITTVNGTDTFDAGSINILYE